jgi:hypothetical protein
MITLPTKSFIQYSIDDDYNEVIIDNLKSFQKGDGTKLVKKIINVYNKLDGNYKLTLCACPQDDTISLEDLVTFWEKQGFSQDAEQGRSDCVLMTY